MATRTNAERLARELADLKRRLEGLERSAAADLRSIDDGTQVVTNEDGEIVLAIGRQPDGSFAVLGQNGGVIVADTAREGSITETEIADAAISTPKLAANAVTADKLEVGLLAAGFVLTGRIQVGDATWDPENGLVIPQPDGGAIILPADGETSAQISGHLIAKSLTIEDDTTIGGGAQVTGSIALTDGVTTPQSSPSLSAAHMSMKTGLPYDYGDIYYGLTNRIDSTDLVTATSFFGSGIYTINRDTGEQWPFYDTSSWSQYGPEGGIVTLENKYYVLCRLPMDLAAGEQYDTWYVLELNSDFSKSNKSPLYFKSDQWVRGRPTLGVNRATGKLACVWTNHQDDLKYHPVDVATWNLEGQVLLRSGTGSIPLAGCPIGTFDVGGAAKMFVAAQTPWRGVDVFYEGGSSADEWDFQGGGSAPMKGMFWDDVESRFLSLDDSGRVWRYSGITADVQVRAAHSWYDANPDGGTHETQVGVEAAYAMPARMWPKVTVPPPPDANVTDPAQTDKADRIKVYMATGTNALRLQGEPLTPDNRTMTLDRISTTGDGVPAENTFVYTDASPGRIDSAAERLDGTPKTVLLGNGVARLDGVVPPGVIMLWSSDEASIPDGWLRCDGFTYQISAYPDLFDVVGTRYGGDGVSTFAVPDLRSRFPVGAGSIGDVGGNEGIASDFDRPARHDHAHDHGGQTGQTDADRRVDSTNTSNNNDNYANHRHPISSDGDGAHPHLALHFIIRT